MLKAISLRLKTFKLKKSSTKKLQVAPIIETTRGTFRVLNLPQPVVMLDKFKFEDVPSMTPSVSEDSTNNTVSKDSQISDDMSCEWPTITVVESWKISTGSNINNTPSTNKCCRGCGRLFEYDNKNVPISSPDSIDPSLCVGCERLFDSTEKTKIQLRFDPSTNKNTNNNPKIESYYISEVCLHHHPNGSSNETDKVYHLPLSTNYYTKTINQGNVEFTLCESHPIPNKVAHFMGCKGCRVFVETEMNTLKTSATKAGQIVVGIPLKKMFKFMIENTNCMVSKMQGCWSSFIFDFFSLTLDFKCPPSRGGFFQVDNFQVCLEGTKSLREMFGDQEFRKWIEALKKHQGYHHIQ